MKYETTKNKFAFLAQILIFVFFVPYLTIYLTINCPKCQGTGTTNFLHIANGKCFTCNGDGYIPFSEDYDILLDDFLIKGKPNIEFGTPCRIKTASLTIAEGGLYIAKTVGQNIIIWDAAHEADWHLEIPVICETLLKKHFERVEK